MYRLSWYCRSLISREGWQKASELQSQAELRLKDSPPPKCDLSKLPNSSLVARAEDNAYLSGLP